MKVPLNVNKWYPRKDRCLNEGGNLGSISVLNEGGSSVKTSVLSEGGTLGRTGALMRVVT